MALLNEDQVESNQGFEKTIDKAGLGMVMDNLQRYQYTYPIKSTVRETASNAEDSHREREIAKSILLGNSRVEDHYVVREGDIFTASKFNPEYYDLKWLSDERDVQIEYFERDDEERDLLRFTDFGVGLGGKRLEGFFSLSYSTKRLNKSALGKFGIGAKAPLSTGVPSYKVTTYYNGETSSFDVFSRFIQPLTPRWGEDEVENKRYEFEATNEKGEHQEYFTEPTDRKNGLIIELEVKKHNRSAVREAVQSQLLYFAHIKFTIHHETYSENVPVATEIFHESTDFIISKNDLYTKPHLVLGTEGALINYGVIDFKELELEPRLGNVGIKVDGSEIEITPSRESVVWSPQTRDVILKKFNIARDEATALVTGEMSEPDFLKWISKSISLWTSGAMNNPVLRQLSGMIDKSSIQPSYSLDPTIKYESVLKMVGVYANLRYVTFENKYINNVYKWKISRTETSSFANVNMQHFYITRKSANPRKDGYIKSQYSGQFHLLYIPDYDDEYWQEEELKVRASYVGRYHEAEDVDTLNIAWSDEEIELGVKAEYDKKRAEYQKALRFLELASESKLYQNYDDIQVPADWVDNVAGEEEHSTDGTRQIIQVEYVDHNKRRKEEGKLFFKYASWNTVNGFSYNPYHFNKETGEPSYDSDKVRFNWDTNEDYAEFLNNYDKTLVYATQRGIGESIEDSDEGLLIMASGLLLSQAGARYKTTPFDKVNKIADGFDNGASYNFYPLGGAKYKAKVADDIILLKVAKPLAKKLQNFLPIRKFLLDKTEEGVIFTHKKIMNWFTAKQIHSIVQQLQFLKNFGEISPYHAKIWEDLWQETRGYHFDDFARLRDYPKDLQESFVATLDKMYEFQRWIDEEKPETDDIALKSIDLFGTADNTGALAVNMDIIRQAEALRDWAQPVVNHLNNIPFFTQKSSLNDATDSEEFFESVRHFMRSKSVEMKQLDPSQIPVEVEEEEDDYEDED